MSIYVEILIRAPMEELWRMTQTPELHERWDLRFTKIEYLSRPDEAAPQRFLYETHIGFGLAIRGEGETVGSRNDADGRRTSALKFWSDDPKSLIRDGGGYWQYSPADEGNRFLTRYDYRVRFGPVGRAFDALVFRPLLGWATAWSFDRLRLWLEKGIDPSLSRQKAVLHALATLTLALVWIYQGAVPKLLMRDANEAAMLIEAGVPTTLVWMAIVLLGAGEVLMGLLTLALSRRKWLFGLTIALMTLATVTVIWNSPYYLTTAFNAPTLNLLMTAMAVVGWITCRDLPSARRCRRSNPERSP
jgi:hypothetical protein